MLLVRSMGEVKVGNNESGTAAESESGSARLTLAVYGKYLDECITNKGALQAIYKQACSGDWIWTFSHP